MKELSAMTLMQCEVQANLLCESLYGAGASLLAQLLCEVATLYAVSVETVSCDARQVLEQCTASELADFFEEYQQRFLAKGGCA